MATITDEAFEAICLRAVQRDAVTIDRLRHDLDMLRRERDRLYRTLAAKDETIAVLMGAAEGKG